MRNLFVALMIGALALSTGVASAAPATQSPEPQPAEQGQKAAEKSAGSVKASSVESEKLDPKLFEQKSDKQVERQRSNGGSGAMGRLIFGLLVVLGAIYGVHTLLKRAANARLQGPGGSATGVVEVLASTPLAQGRMLHVVRIGEEVAVLGATEHSITRIGTLATDGVVQTSSGLTPGFSSALSTAMTGVDPIAQAVSTGLTGTATALATAGGATPVRGGAQGAQDQGFWSRFVANLQLMTSR